MHFSVNEQASEIRDSHHEKNWRENFIYVVKVETYSAIKLVNKINLVSIRRPQRLNDINAGVGEPSVDKVDVSDWQDDLQKPYVVRL